MAAPPAAAPATAPAPATPAANAAGVAARAPPSETSVPSDASIEMFLRAEEVWILFTKISPAMFGHVFQQRLGLVYLSAASSAAYPPANAPPVRAAPAATAAGVAASGDPEVRLV